MSAQDAYSQLNDLGAQWFPYEEGEAHAVDFDYIGDFDLKGKDYSVFALAGGEEETLLVFRSRGAESGAQEFQLIDDKKELVSATRKAQRLFSESRED